MNKTRDDMDWIEDFLDGSLNTEEAKEFHSKLKSHPAFAKKYQQRLRLQEAWQTSEKYHVEKTKVDSIIRLEKSSMLYRRNFILVAASIIVVMGLTSILLFVLHNKSTKQLQQADILADSIEKLDNLKGPQQIDIPKYGRSDTLPTKDNNEIVLLSPANHAEFFHGDSIHFQWKANQKTSELFIKDILKDSLIFNFRLPVGKSDYNMATSFLKTGSYTWFINEPITTREFTVRERVSKKQ
jgi:hypothetical protein